MSPAPPDYVDVSERIRQFYKKHPKGSLQSEILFNTEGFIAVKAWAYRMPDDPRPGTGLAWEPVPGPTPFTKNSELQNAETSAWGRAIVALGFETKNIASANEVQNRRAESSASGEAGTGEGLPPAGVAAPPASPGASDFQNPAEKQTRDQMNKFRWTLGELKELDPDQDWTAQAKAWTEKKFSKQSSKDLTRAEMSTLIDEFEGRRLKLAIHQANVEAADMEDPQAAEIPFS